MGRGVEGGGAVLDGGRMGLGGYWALRIVLFGAEMELVLALAVLGSISSCVSGSRDRNRLVDVSTQVARHDTTRSKESTMRLRIRNALDCF